MIISRVISSHIGPMYFETPYIKTIVYFRYLNGDECINNIKNKSIRCRDLNKI